MLSLEAAVRECNIKKHLQAERELISLSFAFDHQNYARYGSYQHVFLHDLKRNNSVAFQDLKSKGMGASISSEPFSSINGDLVTELLNKETKGTSGPFRPGFSTNVDTVNTWVRTIHIHGMLQVAFRKQLKIKTSSNHKESTRSGKNMHRSQVESLISNLRGFGTNPFLSDAPKCIPIGVVVDHSVAHDMLQASSIGSKCLETFYEERLVIGTKSFFDPIKKQKLKTGIVPMKKKIKAVAV